MLESLFNKAEGLQVFSCEYFKIAKSSFFIEHLRWLLLEMFRLTLYFQKDVAEFSLHHSLSFVVPFVVACCTTCCHSLYHSFSLVALLVVTRFHSLYARYHSLSLVAPLVVT